MKKKTALLLFPRLSGFILLCCALIAMAWHMRPAEADLNGAWRLVRSGNVTGQVPETVKILADQSFTFATYDQQQKRFIGAGGGTFDLDKGTYTETFEYFTQDSTRVGSTRGYEIRRNGDKLELSYREKGGKITETWQRIDSGSGKQPSLAGAWRIRERETQPGQMTVIRQGPRKTIKWLSDTRFQWAAINTETKQFFGTGGGTYSLRDGKYTEHIAFFSRDPRRVGMRISFDYELKNGDWHHRGLSTAGNKIYEIWTRAK